MGFSVIGFILALCIFAPNLIMIALPPHNVPADLVDAGIMFTILERIGQISCLALLVLSKSSFQNRGINTWFIVQVICIALYIALWGRYAVTGRNFAALFSFGAIPIPMAILPVLAFGFAAVWGKSVWLGIADILFAVGHIANSLHTYNQIK